MMSKHNQCTLIEEALKLAPPALNDMFGKDTIVEGYSFPHIHLTYHAYGSTAGPFGGIGGQAITSFPHVTLVYEMEHVLVYIGRGKFCCGQMTPNFSRALADGQNPWAKRKELNIPNKTNK